MNMTVYVPERLQTLGRFLREELTEHRPGRFAQAMQLGSLCLLVVLVSMTLQVPLLAVSIIVLFYGVQPNSFFTRVVAVVFVIANALDMSCLLLILKYAYGYPLLRIFASSVVLLGSMYLMRVHKLGLVFFAVALVVIYGQTVPDSLDLPEVALRVVMWSLAAGLYPVLLMVIVCGYLFPSRPTALMQEEAQRQLAEVAAQLEHAADAPASANEADAPSPERIEKDAIALQNLHPFASADDAGYRAIGGYWQACAAAIGYLRATVHAVTARGLALDEAGKSLLRKLRAEVGELADSVQRAEPYRSRWTPSATERAAAVEHRLGGACRTLTELARFDVDKPVPKAPKGSQFVADIKTNPMYLRFALKTVLASLICYTFYHGVQWDGIHTCLLTCVIVAYPSTGASFQKMMLRFGGAAIGALLALTLSILVVPRIDSIAALLLMLAPVFFTGAWIATGSERSSYIGTQLSFTFTLAMLEKGFGPTTDLTEIRDRAIGILIGLVVSAVVYTLIWPESEAGTLRQKLADALRESGKLFRRPVEAGGSSHIGYLEQRMACWTAFKACEDMRERVALEVNIASGAKLALLEHARGVLERNRQILDQCDALHNAAVEESCEDSAQWQAWRDQVADTLDRYAEGLCAEPVAAGTPAPLAAAISAGVSPVLAAQARQLSRLVTRLPDWTAPASPWAKADAHTQQSS